MWLLHREAQDGLDPVELCLTYDGEIVTVWRGAESIGVITSDAIEKVMLRYGRPLADGIDVEEACLPLGRGRTLRRLRHRARYDVLPRDFIVFAKPGTDRVAELSVSVTAAILHLLKAAASLEKAEA